MARLPRRFIPVLVQTKPGLEACTQFFGFATKFYIVKNAFNGRFNAVLTT
jgi:hypothetical protein